MNCYESTPVSATSDDDSSLVCRWRSGDDDAFTLLFEKHYPLVRNFAVRFLQSLPSGEDVAQETFVRLARKVPDCPEGATLRSWLLRVALNLCKDHIRSESNHRRKLAEYEQERSLPPDAGDGAQRVREALASLPPDRRAAVILVYYENYTHAEAAQALGCAEATISWRIMLAKRKLKSLLKE